MEDAVMLTKQACIEFQFLRRSRLAAIDLPFQGSDTISKSSNILRQLQGLTPLVGGGILHPFSRIRVCGIDLALIGKGSVENRSILTSISIATLSPRRRP